MIRQRDEDNEQCTQKRVCPSHDYNHAQTIVTEGVLHRCMTWLINLPPRDRPNTPERLQQGLAHLCAHDYSVDINVLFFHLIFNGIISVREEPNEYGVTKIVTVNPNPNPSNHHVVFVPDSTDTGQDRVSNDFKVTLKRAIIWVQSEQGLQLEVSTDKFLHSLARICTQRCHPQGVMDNFLSRGMVCFRHDGVVCYNLPEQSIQGGYYMAFAH